MNRRQKLPPQRIKTPAYRPALERLDAARKKNTPWNNYEIIRLMRQAAFADVEEYGKTNPVIIPK